MSQDSASCDRDAPDGETKAIQRARDQIEQLQQAPGFGDIPLPSDFLPSDGAAAGSLPSDSFPGYEILGEIHRGGQGVVYEAVQNGTKRKVAVKVMKEGPFASERDKARFEREVEVLGQLSHPNIVAIHDSGMAAGSFYFVMDYISGQSLDAWLAAKDRSVEESLQLFVKICEAVNAAHLRGVIHRDLKPGNVRIDAEGQPHVLDFGLAKVAMGEEASVMTVTGQFVGSLPWASPEQAEGVPSKIDTRTDVYSLGVILYQMLTGTFPYDVVGNMRDVLDRIMKTEPARPSTVCRQIDDEVETIVLKCLAKERERRYQSAGELARDVRHYLAGEPIEAKGDSTWYVLCKQLHRYRFPAATGAVVALLLLTSCVFAWVLYAQERRLLGKGRALAVERERFVQSQQDAIEELRRVQRQTQGDLYRALMGRASALRMARRPGYRHEVWDCLSQARAIDIPESKLETIRDEVLACLGDFVGLDSISSPPPLPARSEIPIAVRTAAAGRLAGALSAYSSLDDRRRWALASLGDTNKGGTVSLWDSQGTHLGTAASPLGLVHDVALTPDGGMLLAACEHGWAAFSVPELTTCGVFRGDVCCSVAVHPGGRTATVAGHSEFVQLWSLSSNRLLAQFEVTANTEKHYARYTPDGRFLLVSGDAGRILAAWRIDGTPERRLLGGHRGGITDLAFSPDKRYLASASKDLTVRIWNLTEGTLLATCAGHEAPPQSIAFSPVGEMLASGEWGGGGQVRIWNSRTGELISNLPVPGFLDQIWRLRFSPGGTYLAAGGNMGLVVWRIDRQPGGLRAIPVLSQSGFQLRDLDIHPEEQQLVFADNSGWLYRASFPTQSPSRSAMWIGGAAFPIYSLDFTADGRSLRFFMKTGQVAAYDWTKRTIVRTTSEAFVPAISAVTHDGRWLAARKPRNRLRIYDLALDKEMLQLPPEPCEIWSLDWAPDGQRVAVGLCDGELAVWDLREVRARLEEFGIPLPAITVEPAEPATRAASRSTTQAADPSNSESVAGKTPCFSDDFEYPDGRLNGQGSWFGIPGDGIELTGGVVRILSGNTTNWVGRQTHCRDSGLGYIPVSIRIRSGIGDSNIWGLGLTIRPGPIWPGGTVMAPRPAGGLGALTRRHPPGR
jgi:WD40 repeat protein